jgi:hypothetical protein
MPRIHLPLLQRATKSAHWYCFWPGIPFTSARLFSTTSRRDFDEEQALKMPLHNQQQQQAEPTLLDRSEKSFFERFLDKYSFSRQTNRILMAESFLQAATTQASDP